MENLTVRSPYKVSATHITFLEYPGLMEGIRMPYVLKVDKLILEPGEETEKIYSRQQ